MIILVLVFLFKSVLSFIIVEIIKELIYNTNVERFSNKNIF
jgi:hypothetical protein